MAAATKFLINYNLKRCVSSSAVNRKAYGIRQGRFMKKLMCGDVGKRKWYPDKERSAASPIAVEKLTSNHVTRRMTVLNKLFMQHITDLMAMGDASTELLGRNIEVTHVRVTPDFQKVLVFWGSKIGDGEVETTKILNDCAFRIRHELTQLRVIGQVPLIQFVKNKQLAGLADLERRFSIADYGEDFQPTVMQLARKPELTLTASFSPEIREKILKLEDSLKEEEEEEEDDSKYDVDLPTMRHDVLGLDHHAIMNRVKVSLKKTQEGARNRLLNVTSINPSETAIPFDPSSFQSQREDSQAFTDFLVKRQIEERRKVRRERKESILTYNLRTNNYVDDEDDEFPDEEKDVDAFEDADLETLK